jgi:phage baseplate assembly protein W
MVDDADIRMRYGQERGDILLTDIVEQINESIRNILETRVGSRLFNRSFGSGITDLLFEPISDLIASLVFIRVQRAIDTFEPRVRFLPNRSSVSADPDNNIYQIRLAYIILETGETSEFDTILNAQ